MALFDIILIACQMKMQSETAGVAPAAAIWRTGLNQWVSSLVLANWLRYVNNESSTKPEIHGMTSDKDRATVTDKMYRKKIR